MQRAPALGSMLPQLFRCLGDQTVCSAMPSSKPEWGSSSEGPSMQSKDAHPMALKHCSRPVVIWARHGPPAIHGSLSRSGAHGAPTGSAWATMADIHGRIPRGPHKDSRAIIKKRSFGVPLPCRGKDKGHDGTGPTPGIQRSGDRSLAISWLVALLMVAVEGLRCRCGHSGGGAEAKERVRKGARGNIAGRHRQVHRSVASAAQEEAQHQRHDGGHERHPGRILFRRAEGGRVQGVVGPALFGVDDGKDAHQRARVLVLA